MQVAQPGPAPLVPFTVETSAPTYNPSPNVDQFIHIHELDSNSMELDLQYSDEEKRILLDKQSAANPWYTNTHCLFMWLSIRVCHAFCNFCLLFFFFYQAPVCGEQPHLKNGPSGQTQSELVICSPVRVFSQIELFSIQFLNKGLFRLVFFF